MVECDKVPNATEGLRLGYLNRLSKSVNRVPLDDNPVAYTDKADKRLCCDPALLNGLIRVLQSFVKRLQGLV